MKYCPLCAAEYREGLDRCASCGATLVASLKAEQVRANPPRLLWIGGGAAEFDLVAGALREANIPELVEEGPTRFLQRFLNRESQICVLQNDFERALEVAAKAIAGGSDGYVATQKCHQCGIGCSAALTACPACKSILIVEQKIKGAASVPGTAAAKMGAKYCPLCDAEYPANYERCSVCGARLVREDLRGKPLSEQEQKDRIAIVWRGGDPVAVSEVVSRLRGAGILHHVESTHDYLVFGLAMPRPKYVARVLQGDVEKARELLAGIMDSPFFGAEPSPGLGEAPPSAPRRAATKWNLAAATVEIWAGDDAAFARLLEDCLRENRIGFRRQGREGGRLQLFVMREDQAQALEIVREVLEATPPA